MQKGSAYTSPDGGEREIAADAKQPHRDPKWAAGTKPPHPNQEGAADTQNAWHTSQDGAVCAAQPHRKREGGHATHANQPHRKQNRAEQPHMELEAPDCATQLQQGAASQVTQSQQPQRSTVASRKSLALLGTFARVLRNIEGGNEACR